MGLEEVETDIKRRIESKVAAIKKSAETEADQIIEEAKLQVKELRKARDLEAQNISEELRNREVAAANLSAKKLRMDAKKEAIERVYNRVVEKLMNLQAEEKKELLTSLVAKATEELQDAKYVLCNKDDAKIVQGIVKKFDLSAGDNIECIGGVVVENHDKTIRVDYTFDSLIEQFKRNTLKEASEQIFAK